MAFNDEERYLLDRVSLMKNADVGRHSLFMPLDRRRRRHCRPRRSSASSENRHHEHRVTQKCDDVSSSISNVDSALVTFPTRELQDCVPSLAVHHPKTVRLLNCWNFDIFLFHKLALGHSCFYMAMQLIREHELISQLHLDMACLHEALMLIESSYVASNPYHTAQHAADVTQAMHCFITEHKLRQHLTPLETLTALLSALCHDADHPGVNQAYLTKTQHHLAVLYQEKSVLENHHWRIGISMLHKSRLLNHLSVEARQSVFTGMRDLILATDITQQGAYIARFSNTLTASQNNLNLALLENKTLVLQMALKCADICNTSREWQFSERWASMVVEEFFHQGDLERGQGLPVAPMMDRFQSNKAAIQIGFICHLVRPLFEQWHRFMQSPLSERMCALIESNLQRWQALQAECSEPEAQNSAVSAPGPAAPLAAKKEAHSSTEEETDLEEPMEVERMAPHTPEPVNLFKPHGLGGPGIIFASECRGGASVTGPSTTALLMTDLGTVEERDDENSSCTSCSECGDWRSHHPSSNPMPKNSTKWTVTGIRDGRGNCDRRFSLPLNLVGHSYPTGGPESTCYSRWSTAPIPDDNEDEEEEEEEDRENKNMGVEGEGDDTKNAHKDDREETGVELLQFAENVAEDSCSGVLPTLQRPPPLYMVFAASRRRSLPHELLAPSNHGKIPFNNGMPPTRIHHHHHHHHHHRHRHIATSTSGVTMQTGTTAALPNLLFPSSASSRRRCSAPGVLLTEYLHQLQHHAGQRRCSHSDIGLAIHHHHHQHTSTRPPSRPESASSLTPQISVQ